MKTRLLLPLILVGCTTIYREGKPAFTTGANMKNVTFTSGDVTFTASEINHSLIIRAWGSLFGTLATGATGAITASKVPVR